jgi:citrate lyase subunit beta/citryl-CoA lyase
VITRERLVRMAAKKALRWARILRMLWPQPQSTAKIVSPRVPLVETVAALPQMMAIAAADPRMAAMGIGGEDLATGLGAAPTADALYVWAALEDPESYRAGLRSARALGFAAASCVHVPVISEEYDATEEELDRARRLVVAFDVALS